jgi:hypothetical protein
MCLKKLFLEAPLTLVMSVRLPGPTYHNDIEKSGNARPALSCFYLLFYFEPFQDLKSCPATRLWGAGKIMRYSSYSFFTSALEGGEWSASRPGRALSLGEKPRYPTDKRLGGSQVGLEAEDRGRNLCPCRGSNPGLPVRCRSLYWLSYPAPISRYTLLNIRNTLVCRIQ